MTNFEKFKQELTLEQFLKITEEVDCDNCPAESCCKCDTEVSCTQTIREWGNQANEQ